MRVQLPLTIEILGLKDGASVVIERVIGGTVYLDEAKRIGQRLLSIAAAEAAPMGYCILTHNHELIYDWEVGRNELSNQHQRTGD
jgi:hypothetical protein